MARPLIVEDDPAFSSLLNRILQEDAGFEGAIIAATLAEARKVLGKVDPPLVLLDLGLPDGRGVELLKDIPEDVCTIVVTVFDEEPDVIAAMAHGANAYLLKDDPEKHGLVQSATTIIAELDEILTKVRRDCE